MDDMVTIKRGDLEQVVRNALRLGSQAFGVKHKRLVQGLMEEAAEKAIPLNEAGREYGFSIERDEDKVYGDFVDVDEDLHASTYGDAEHVIAWVAERLGVSLEDAKRRKAVAEAKLQEARLAAMKLPAGACIVPTDEEKTVSLTLEFDADGWDDTGHLQRLAERENPTADIKRSRGKPWEETGCGVEECCPSLPAEIVMIANEQRRKRLFEEACDAIWATHNHTTLRERLQGLTDDQLAQVIHLARP